MSSPHELPVPTPRTRTAPGPRSVRGRSVGVTAGASAGSGRGPGRAQPVCTTLGRCRAERVELWDRPGTSASIYLTAEMIDTKVSAWQEVRLQLISPMGDEHELIDAAEQLGAAWAQQGVPTLVLRVDGRDRHPGHASWRRSRLTGGSGAMFTGKGDSVRGPLEEDAPRRPARGRAPATAGGRGTLHPTCDDVAWSDCCPTTAAPSARARTKPACPQRPSIRAAWRPGSRATRPNAPRAVHPPP